MELGIFVVALVLIVGIGVLAFGRMPFPVRQGPAADSDADPGTTRTAEPPGRVDDSG